MRSSPGNRSSRGEQGGCSQHNPSSSLPNLQDGHSWGWRAQRQQCPRQKQSGSRDAPKMIPKLFSPCLKFWFNLFHRDGAIPHAHLSSNRLGLIPGLPILLQPQLEYKAQKIPVDPQATDWKLYFNKQKKRAFFFRSCAWDESENKIPVPK